MPCRTMGAMMMMLVLRILAANVADMSATCDTVAGFRRHGAVTATQNQLTVPTLYVGISIYVGRYTSSDDICR